MNWTHSGPGTWNGSGSCGECYPADPPPPPTSVATEGQDRQWAGSGQGTATSWYTTLANSAKVYETPDTIDRPPSSLMKVPWEKCSGYTLVMEPPTYPLTSGGTYTRTASTIAHSKSNAPMWPKPKRFVVVSCSATDKTDGSDLSPGSEPWHLGEPVEGDGGAWINPATTDITIAGKKCDVGGTVFLEIDKVSEQDVTPQINVQWYSYGLTESRPKAVTLTWSRHQCGGPPTRR